MTKKKFKIIIVIGAGIFAAAVVLCLLLFKWSDYEYYETYTTADKAHDIDLYVSYPFFHEWDVSARRRYKIVCKDNSNGREVEYAEFDFEPCKGCKCSFENDDGQKCTISVFDCSGFRSFDIVWSEIFT